MHRLQAATPLCVWCCLLLEPILYCFHIVVGGALDFFHPLCGRNVEALSRPHESRYRAIVDLWGYRLKRIILTSSMLFSASAAPLLSVGTSAICGKNFTVSDSQGGAVTHPPP